MVTGVRWAESTNRRNTHGVANVQGKPKTTRKLAEDMGAEYRLNKHGEVIMNDDNDANRRMVEQCYRTQKTMVNPIVDWTDKDVWDFLNENGIPHCGLYDEGYTRLGCIGCPLAGTREMLRDFERYPKYKENYIRAFQRMIDRHPGQIRILDPESDTKFKLDVNSGENSGGGISAFGSNNAIDGDSAPEVNGTAIHGGGVPLRRGPHPSALRAATFPRGEGWERPCSGGGSKRITAEAMFERWIRFWMC